MQSELERNKEAVTRFNREVIEQGNVKTFEALMDSEFVNRSAPLGPARHGQRAKRDAPYV